MPFAVAAAGIGAAGTIGGAMLSSNATRAATSAATNAQNEQFYRTRGYLQDAERQATADLYHFGVPAIEALERGGNQARADLVQGRDAALGYMQPWQDVGRNALMVTGDLSGANGPDAARAAMANFQTSPGYDWRFQQGLRASDAGAASQGMLRSGAQIKAEQEYGQGLASQEFENYYRRLAALSGQGQQAAATGAQTQLGAAQSLGQAALNTGQNTSTQMIGLGQNLANVAFRAAGGSADAAMQTGANNAQTLASGGTAQANIIGNAAQGLGNIGQQYLQNLYYQNALMGPATYGVSAPGTPGISANGNPVMVGYAPSRTATPAPGGGYNWGV